MSTLRQTVADYLAVRRVLGYKLDKAEKLLAQFVTYLEDLGKQPVTIETAVAWASLPSGAHQSWLSFRLSIVRRFAVHLHGIDPSNEVPPADLLPGRSRRATPYFYSDGDIATLIAVAGTLNPPHRVATYQTLIGLLAITGMRVGEAIKLDYTDFDANNGVLIALLSTYLGHVDPGKTYWYLSAAPELLELAGARLDRHVGGGS
jgi:site-specific recombinase XerD